MALMAGLVPAATRQGVDEGPRPPGYVSAAQAFWIRAQASRSTSVEAA
jgi:hypothetical protein